MARASRQQLIDAMQNASRQVAKYRASGNQTLEIEWRKELQRVSNLYSHSVAGQAIDDAQLSPGEHLKAGLPKVFAGVEGLLKTGIIIYFAVMIMNRMET